MSVGRGQSLANRGWMGRLPATSFEKDPRRLARMRGDFAQARLAGGRERDRRARFGESLRADLDAFVERHPHDAHLLAEPLELCGGVAKEIHGIWELPDVVGLRGARHVRHALERLAHDDEVHVALRAGPTGRLRTEKDHGFHAAKRPCELRPKSRNLLQESCRRAHATTSAAILTSISASGGVIGFSTSGYRYAT